MTDLKEEKNCVTVAVRIRPAKIPVTDDLSVPFIETRNNNVIISTTGVPLFSSPRPPREGRRGNHMSLPANSCIHREIFSFDHIFDNRPHQENSVENSQADLFHVLGRPLLDKAIEGINVCLFAYGMTSSGKTHSMMGSSIEPGLIPRFCEHLLQRQQSSETHLTENGNNHSEFIKTQMAVSMSYLEIYNEKLYDLLNPSQDKSTSKLNLHVREHAQLGAYVDGLSNFPVDNLSQVTKLISLGNKMRATAATQCNERSSRSHAVMILDITQEMEMAPDVVDVPNVMDKQMLRHMKCTRRSKVCLVDLAGSERLSRTGNTGNRLEESKNINLSLLALGKVISQLADRAETNIGGVENKLCHIPYRDSQLTWLLKESLGGNSKTTMLATISPDRVDLNETLNTLRYATKAKSIENRVHINEDSQSQLIREFLTNFRRENDSITNELNKLREDLKAKDQLIIDIQQRFKEPPNNANNIEKESSTAKLTSIALKLEEKMKSFREMQEQVRQSVATLSTRSALAGVNDRSMTCYRLTRDANVWLKEAAIPWGFTVVNDLFQEEPLIQVIPPDTVAPVLLKVSQLQDLVTSMSQPGSISKSQEIVHKISDLVRSTQSQHPSLQKSFSAQLFCRPIQHMEISADLLFQHLSLKKFVNCVFDLLESVRWDEQEPPSHRSRICFQNFQLDLLAFTRSLLTNETSYEATLQSIKCAYTQMEEAFMNSFTETTKYNFHRCACVLLVQVHFMKAHRDVHNCHDGRQQFVKLRTALLNIIRVVSTNYTLASVNTSEDNAHLEGIRNLCLVIENLTTHVTTLHQHLMSTQLKGLLDAQISCSLLTLELNNFQQSFDGSLEKPVSEELLLSKELISQLSQECYTKATMSHKREHGFSTPKECSAKRHRPLY